MRLSEKQAVRFTLRSLLILVLLCAIPLAWYGIQYRQFQREQEIVGKLERVVVHRANDSLWGMARICSIEGSPYYVHMPQSMSDETAASLAELDGLEVLELNVYYLRDDQLPYLARCTKLRKLRLAGDKITDAGLLHLAPLKDLRELKLTWTKTTHEGAARLQKLLPKLVILVN